MTKATYERKHLNGLMDSECLVHGSTAKTWWQEEQTADILIHKQEPERGTP